MTATIEGAPTTSPKLLIKSMSKGVAPNNSKVSFAEGDQKTLCASTVTGNPFLRQDTVKRAATMSLSKKMRKKMVKCTSFGKLVSLLVALAAVGFGAASYNPEYEKFSPMVVGPQLLNMTTTMAADTYGMIEELISPPPPPPPPAKFLGLF